MLHKEKNTELSTEGRNPHYPGYLHSMSVPEDNQAWLKAFYFGLVCEDWIFKKLKIIYLIYSFMGK